MKFLGTVLAPRVFFLLTLFGASTGAAYIWLRSKSIENVSFTERQVINDFINPESTPSSTNESDGQGNSAKSEEEPSAVVWLVPSPTPNSSGLSVTPSQSISGIINANLLQGGSWASPLILGSSTPNSAVFANVTMNGSFTSKGAVTLQQFQNGFLRVNGVGEMSASRISLSSSTDVADRLPTASGGTGNDFSGSPTGSVVTFSNTGQMTIVEPGTDGYVLTSNGPGSVPSWRPSAGGAGDFSTLASGENTTSDFIIGSGSSLGYDGSGVLNASALLGSTWGAPGAIGSTTRNTGAFTAVSATGATTPLTVGSSSQLQVDDNGRMAIAYTGNSGYLSSSGGVIFINNTNNIGSGIGIYSNAGSEAQGNMINVKVDNPAYNQAAFYMNYDGVSNAVEIVSNTNDSSSNALSVTGNNILDSTVGIIGNELDRGTVKISHYRPGTGNDSSASGLSIDLKGVGTRAQGVYVDSTETGGTLGNLLRLRNESVDKFVVNYQGNLSMAGNFTQGANGTDTTFTKQGNTSGDQFFVGTNGAFRVQRSAANSEAFRVQVNGDSQGRWLGTSDGQLKWGPGNATQDVILRRGSAGTLFLDGAIVMNNLNQALDTVIKGDIESNLFFVNGTTDRIGIGTSSPVAALHIVRATGALPTLLLNNTSSGDLFTASSSGTTHFTIANNGDTSINGGLSVSGTTTFGGQSYTWPAGGQSNGYVLTTNGSGTLTWTDPGAASTNYWQLNGTVLSPATITDQVALGTTTAQAGSGLHVERNSANNALVVLNQTGSGDILTASSSGTTRFTLAENGNMTVLGNIAQGANGTNTTFTKTGNTAGDEFFVGTNGAFRVTRTASGSEAFRTQVNGDSQGRWVGTSDGRLSWGSGSATQDVTLRRGAAGVLYLDGVIVMNNSNQALDTVIKGNLESNLLYVSGTTDRIGIGTSSPLASLHISKNAGTLPGLIVNNTGTGDIFVASGSGSTRMVVTNSGSVGIGVTNPSNALEVSGTGTIASFVASHNAGVNPSLEIRNSSTNFGSGSRLRLMMGSSTVIGEVVAQGDSGSNAGSSIQFRNRQGGNTTEAMRIDSSGNLGIGISSPASTLHVHAAFGGGAGVIFNQQNSGDIFAASSSGTTRMVLSNSGNLGVGTNSPGGRIEARSSTDSLIRVRTTNSGGSNIAGLEIVNGGSANWQVRKGAGTSEALEFYNSSGGVVGSWTSTGLLGIGTTSQAAPLHVNGSYIGNAAAIINQTNGQDIFTASASGTTRFTIANNGNVTVGSQLIANQVVSSLYQIDSNNSMTLNATNTMLRTGGNIYMGLDSDNGDTNRAFIVQTNSGTAGSGTELFRIQETGLVGIGTASPAAPLHVNGSYIGNAAAIINQTNGQDILTASASGTTRLVVTNAGSVGIGISSPNARLDLKSSATNSDVLRWEASDGSRLGRFLETSGGHGWFEVDNSSGTAVALFRADGGNSYLSTGLFGFGTTSPTGKVEISGGNGGNASLIVNQTLNGDIFTASSSGTSRFVINNAGFVGVGTSDPIAGLHVSRSMPNTPAFIVNQDNSAQPIMTASASGTTRMILTNDGRIGLGTLTPGYKLDVLDTNNGTGGIRAVNSNSGNLAAATVGFGADNHAAGFVAFSSTYDGGFGLSHFAGRAALLTDLSNPGNGLDFVSAKASGNIKFYTGGFGTGNERLRIDSNGTTNVLGDLTVTGACSGCSSDERLKTNMVQLGGSSLDKLLSLKGVTYEWSDAQKEKDFPGLQIGVIAQDVEKVFPELVGTDLRGYKYVRYDKLIAPTIEAIREQQSQISSLNGKVFTVGSDIAYNFTSLFNKAGDQWEVVADLVFTKAATFRDRVTFAAATVFKGKAEFEQAITQNKDAAGSVVLPSTAQMVEVKFETAYDQVPYVTVTPVGKSVNGYYVDEVTKTGFKVKVDQALSQDVQFNWQAVQTTTGSVAGTSAPTATVLPSPSVSPSPEISPTPLATPVVSPTPVASPSASPSVSPSPELTPTPNASSSASQP